MEHVSSSALMDPSILVNLVILLLLLVTALAIVSMRHLFSIAMMSGAYSLLSAVYLSNLDAVDVAFTEAAVGAGMSTILVLGALLLTARREAPTLRAHSVVALLVVAVTGGALFYGSLDLPAFADPQAPAHLGVGMVYVERNASDIGVPNIVTSVLASYRGYDTLGETCVVFTAGLSVLMLLGVTRFGQSRASDDAQGRETQDGNGKGDSPS